MRSPRRVRDPNTRVPCCEPRGVVQRIRLATERTAPSDSRSRPRAAYQPYMLNARASLRQAIDSLSKANADKGGHRINAINLCQQAIREIDLGMRYANNH